MSSASHPTYSIGAISRYTGLSVHTIRVWERRYGTFSVERTESGRRIYTDDDMLRFKLLKELTDQGHKISELAPLDIDELTSLQQRFIAKTETKRAYKQQKRVVIWSERLLADLEYDDTFKQHAHIIVTSHDFADIRDAVETHTIDYLFIERSTLELRDLHLFRDLKTLSPKVNFVVVFHFAHRDILNELKRMDAAIMRAPVHLSQLIQLMTIANPSSEKSRQSYSEDTVSHHKTPQEAPPHQFNGRQLRYLSNIQTAIDCECPQHLVDLIMSLSAFEAYSQQCEIRSPKDEALHIDAFKTTANARFMMESLLQKIIDADGISIPPE